jgi:tetratricopeptide (TPR) repeat protein
VHQPDIRRHFKDGILWASLGPKADPANALSAWADALRRTGAVPEHVARLPELGDRAQALRDVIGERRMLLVVDDAWEIDAARVLRCGGARCSHVITTRDKEIAHAFAGRASAQALHAFEEADAWQLLQLLAPEACRADPDAVRRLVRTVGALPQAVRLIGGYLGGTGAGMFGGVFGDLSTKALEDMEDPLKRLQLAEMRLGGKVGSRKTLEETISLSLDGLPEAAQNAFVCLGAFAAKPERFTPEAASAVTEADQQALAALAGRNLLEVDTVSRSLSVHPTIADVARARMPAEAIVRHRHHHLDALKGTGGDPVRADALYPQLRWAWEQAPDDDTLFVLLDALEPYQRYRGLSAETLAWTRRTLRLAEASDLAPAIGRLTELMGDAEKDLGRFEPALDHFRRALAAGERVGAQPWWLIDMHAKIAITLGKLARIDEALEATRRARAVADAAGDRSRQALTLLVAASILRGGDRLQDALATATEALAMLRETGDKVWEVDCLSLLSAIYRDMNDHESALEHARTVMAIQAESGNPAFDAEARLLVARLSGARGQLEDALATARDACARAEASGSRGVLSFGLRVVADLLLKLGRFDEAIAYRQRQLALHDEVGNRAGRADVLQAIGWILHQQERYREAEAANLEALHIYEELGDRVQQANAHELLRFGYSHLEEPGKEAACLNNALRLWRELGDRSAQARVLGDLGRLHLSLDRPGPALAAHAQADALFVEAGDAPGRAAACEFPSMDAARTQFVSRYGPEVLERRPIVPPLVLAVGTRLTRWLGGHSLRPTLLPLIERARETIRLSTGVLPPRTLLTENRFDLPPDAFQIVLDAVPLPAVVMNEDERLFAGPRETLAACGVAGRAAIHPWSGQPATWLVRRDWPTVAHAGEALWTPAEYVASQVDAVMRKHLWTTIGHQQTFEMVHREMPEIATVLRRDPGVLTVLVLVIQNLLEEQVPALPFRPIVETVVTLQSATPDRLRILQAVRLLPDVRPRLPGNGEGNYCFTVPEWLEEEIGAAIQMADNMEYLMMEPERVQQALALVGQHLADHPDATAIVVENARIRRFARKLFELEYPRLFVISRDELLPGRQAHVVNTTGANT